MRSPSTAAHCKGFQKEVEGFEEEPYFRSAQTCNWRTTFGQLSITSIPSTQRRTYIFPNNLLQSGSENIPRKNLNILLNITRFRIRKPHNQLEEILRPKLILRNRYRSEPFEVPSYPVLLLYRESYPYKSFQEIDSVNRSDVTFVLVFSEYAGNDYRVLDVIFK